jgi:hypothetical protein
MKTSQIIFIVLAVISFILAGVMVNQGMDKINNYYNSEDYSFMNENAYVGGDAYNYIINANYATGYYVLALIFVVSGFSCILASFLSQIGGIISSISQIETKLSNKFVTEDKPQPVEFLDLPKL